MTKLDDGLLDNKVTAKDTDAATFLNQIKELEAKRRELEQEALENYAQIRADMKEIRILKSENKRLADGIHGKQKGASTMKQTILFLFNSSDYAVRPWLDDGRFNVVSVDYDDTDHSGAHKKPSEGHTVLNVDLSHRDARAEAGRLIYELGMAPPSLVVSFAPCTDLAVSGAKHFAAKLEQDPDCQNRAVRMAKLASEFGCAYAVENPVSRLATLWRKPDHYWHPYHYGHLCPLGAHPEFPAVIPEQDLYSKKSCLWTGNGFVIPERQHGLTPVGNDNPGWAKLGGKSARTKYIRSLTPRGFANAIYTANVTMLLSRTKPEDDDR